MLTLVRAGLVFFLLLPLWQTATAEEQKIAITETPAVAALEAKLLDVVRDRGLSGTNHFFATRFSDADSQFYLFWREGRAIWILDGAADLVHWDQLLFPRAGAYVDLDSDVVETREDIGTSTYLVDRPWVDSIIAQAVTEGVLITVTNQE